MRVRRGRSGASACRLAFTFAALSGGAALAAGCADHSSPKLIASVEVLPASAIGSVGESAKFGTAVYDFSGNLVVGRPVQWSSSDSAVASVLQEGRVTANHVGSASITATVDGVSGMSSIIVRSAADSQPFVPPAPTVPPPPPTPTEPSSGDVASVVLVPPQATVGLLGTVAYDAVLRDSRAQPLSGRAVEWSVTDALLSSVSPSGIVTGLGIGSATVQASSEGEKGTAPITISLTPPAQAPGWPNLPAGYKPLTDEPLTGALTRFWNIMWNDDGNGTFVNDASAPHSPGGVYQMRYPVGFPGGYAPSTLIHNLGNVRNLFIGLWWKANAEWQGHDSNVNKIQFVFTGDGDGSNFYMCAYGPPGGPYELRVNLQFRTGDTRDWLRPNVDPGRVTMGQWHRIEWLMQYNTPGAANGVMRWWLDGKLAGDYRDIVYSPKALDNYKVSPTWGGMGGAKTQTDYFWYDHLFLAWR